MSRKGDENTIDSSQIQYTQSCQVLSEDLNFLRTKKRRHDEESEQGSIAVLQRKQNELIHWVVERPKFCDKPCIRELQSRSEARELEHLN